jgi:hypothetical protein
MSKETAKELRALAKKLKECCLQSTVLSIASPIVTNACDHLCAIARVHEVNESEIETQPFEVGDCIQRLGGDYRKV